MEDSVLNELLGSIPQGEVIVDAREGDHANAELQGVELVRNSTGSFAVVATFGDLVDSNGRQFNIKRRFNIPEASSETVQKGIFLGELHDLEALPRSHRTAVYAETDTHRDAILRLFKKKGGSRHNLRVTMRDGYPAARVTRGRK